jgi:hypothetical protein
MNDLNSKKNIKNKEDKKPLSKKEIDIPDFNKKLQDFILDIKSKSPSEESIIENKLDEANNNKMDLNDMPQKFKINNSPKTEKINPIFNINVNQQNQNDLSKDKLKKAITRLNIEKLICSDHFADNFILIPSNNYKNGDNYDFPYMKPFNDEIMLQDESIFLILDKDYKNKYLTNEDIKNIKNEEQKLNFGKDPYEIYNQIINSNIFPNNTTSNEFKNSLNDFNIFRGRDPFFLNIKVGNKIQNRDYFIDIYNINEEDQQNGNNSLNSTRYNSKNNLNSEPFIINDRHFTLYNEIDIKEKEEEEKNENDNEDENDNNNENEEGNDNGDDNDNKEDKDDNEDEGEDEGEDEDEDEDEDDNDNEDDNEDEDEDDNDDDIDNDNKNNIDNNFIGKKRKYKK